MAAIEKLARAAIGVDDQRGDLLALENLSFQTAPVETVAAPGKMEKYRLLIQPWTGVLRYAVITLLFLAIYAMVLRPVKKQAMEAFRQIPERLTRALPAAGAGGGLGGLELEGGNNDTKHTQALKKELSEKIKTEPANASRLVQTWIHEQPKH